MPKSPTFFDVERQVNQTSNCKDFLLKHIAIILHKLKERLGERGTFYGVVILHKKSPPVVEPRSILPV